VHSLGDDGSLEQVAAVLREDHALRRLTDVVPRTADPLETAFAELQHSSAVIVAKHGEALGILTRSDLLEFLAHGERSRA